MVRKRSYRKRRTSRRESLTSKFFKRLTRAVLAIIILSAFVLGIAYTVRTASSVSPQKLAGFVSPYLSKFGMSEEQVGEVAGDLIKRATDLGVSGTKVEEETADGNKTGSDDSSTGDVGDTSSASTKRKPQGEKIFSVAIIADSHIANDKDEYKANKDFLRQAIDRSVEKGVETLVHVGDITNWGVTTDLREAKEFLDISGVKYYAIPGDRDLAQSVGPSNFDSVFGERFHTFTIKGNKFVVFDNSANYTLIDEENMDWLRDELSDAKFLILSQPINTDGIALFNCQYMGSSCSTPEGDSLLQKQAQVLEQRDQILQMVRDSNVAAVIAGDHHKSSSFVDKQDPSLTHYFVGAVGGTVNEYSQEVLQSQRFSLVNVYDSGEFELVDVPLAD